MITASSWIDVVGHLAAELWDRARDALTGQAEAVARRTAITLTAPALARAIHRLPAGTVGDDMRAAVLAVIDGAASSAGLSHDERAALYQATMAHVIQLELADVAKGARDVARSFARLP